MSLLPHRPPLLWCPGTANMRACYSPVVSQSSEEENISWRISSCVTKGGEIANTGINLQREGRKPKTERRAHRTYVTLRPPTQVPRWYATENAPFSSLAHLCLPAFKKRSKRLELQWLFYMICCHLINYSCHLYHILESKYNCDSPLPPNFGL